MKPHRFEFENHSYLVDQERERFQPAHEIIDRAKISPGETVADLGCGVGFLTLPLAQRCRSVQALDVQERMLKTLWERAGPKERTVIHLVQCELPVLPYKDGSLDRVMMVNVLHEFEDKRLMVDETVRCLCPGGRISLIDFQKRPTSRGPPLEERIAEDSVPLLFPGLKLLQKYSFESFYQFEFRTP